MIFHYLTVISGARLVSLVGFALFALLGSPVSLGAIDHTPFERVLKQYVDSRGFVDYQGLSMNRAEFDGYLQSIATTGPVTTPENFGSDDAELAYYLNAYNALVIEGVLKKGPSIKSVWNGLISGYSFFRWMKVTLDGSQTSLQSLEDELIRARFRDPRIHAAINCASISCPRLRTQVFVEQKLDEQLNASMIEFVNDEAHVRVKSDRVELSAIFDWFEQDFLEYPKPRERSFTIVDYINQYRKVPIAAGLKVTYLKYNKGINSQQANPQ